jgi:signal transduction histidine kinase
MQEAKVESPRFKVSLDELQTGEAGVKISFEDNGPGVASGMHDKIFDPYMTSKAAGLGLGLPIVRRIAMEHRGRVRCEEVPFGLFVLELPRHVVDA